MRGATSHDCQCACTASRFQSTLPMRGATNSKSHLKYSLSISIHTPHAGSDSAAVRTISFLSVFQSTLPMRGATAHRYIIIHVRRYFNPHSPCGERRLRQAFPVTAFPFQSTLPMRGATTSLFFIFVKIKISIHTPHAGSDNNKTRHPPIPFRFQSTLPMRGATRCQ